MISKKPKNLDSLSIKQMECLEFLQLWGKPIVPLATDWVNWWKLLEASEAIATAKQAAG